MCSSNSNFNYNYNQHRACASTTMQPISVPDDMSDGGNGTECPALSSTLATDSLSPIAVSPYASSFTMSSASSNDDSHSTQHLSKLQKMMDVERTNRSTMNDHRALQDTDPSFHKQGWRERVAQWCYDVLDYLEESRDVASVAMNIIDRYLAVLSKESSSSLIVGEFDYEVISFTALFLAIRVSGSNKELEISELLELSSSSGAPQARHILSAGNSMLEKLSWDHQILTPNAFLMELVGLLMIQHNKESNANERMTRERVSKLVDFASSLTEVSVRGIYFSAVAPSEIAFGALALAMTCNPDLFATDCQHQGFFSRFFQTVHEQTSMDIECPHMNSIISRLLNVYNQSQEAASENIGRETVLWERLANNITAHTNLPHFIMDEVEATSITADGSFSSNNKSEQLIVLHKDGHRVHTITNISRPVSPLPQHSSLMRQDAAMHSQQQGA